MINSAVLGELLFAYAIIGTDVTVSSEEDGRFLEERAVV